MGQDYVDEETGYLYRVSKATDIGNRIIVVPMEDVETHELIGFVMMEAVA